MIIELILSKNTPINKIDKLNVFNKNFNVVNLYQ